MFCYHLDTMDNEDSWSPIGSYWPKKVLHNLNKGSLGSKICNNREGSYTYVPLNFIAQFFTGILSNKLGTLMSSVECRSSVHIRFIASLWFYLITIFI